MVIKDGFRKFLIGGLIAAGLGFGAYFLSDTKSERKTNIEFSSEESAEKVNNQNSNSIKPKPYQEVEENEGASRKINFEHYLEGKVLKADRSPMTNAEVFASNIYFIDAKGQQISSREKPDASGKVRLGVPENSLYDVHATTGNVTRVARDVSPETPFEIVFSGSKLKLRILDAKRNLIEDAETTIKIMDPYHGSVTLKPIKKEKGVYTFSPVEAGTWRATAQVGYLHALEDIALFGDEEKTTEIIMPQGVNFKGKVIDDHDNPVIEAEITLEERGSFFNNSFTTNPDGTFRVIIAPGEYRGNIQALGHVPVALNYFFTDGKEKVYTLTRGQKVTGRIIGASQGLPGARLSIVDMQGNILEDSPTKETTSRDKGDFEIFVKPDAQFGIIASHDNGPEKYLPLFVFPVEVQEGKTLDLEMKQKGYSVSGHVRSEYAPSKDDGINVSSKPDPGWITTFSPFYSAFSRNIQTREDGAFTLADLVEGRHQITARNKRGYGKSGIINVDNNLEGIEIQMPWGANISFEVKDSDGSIIPRAKVIAHDRQNNNSYSGTASERGSGILPNVVPGNFDVLVWDPQKRQSFRNQVGFDGNDPYWKLERHLPPSQIYLEVRDKDGNPMQTISLSYLINSTNGAISISGKVFRNRDGIYQIPLEPGVSIVRVNKLNYSPRQIEIKDDPSRYNVTLSRIKKD